MRKMIVLTVAVAAFALPLAALADGSPSPASVASQTCKALKAADGTGFAAKYGTNASKSNAFGKCVSQNSKSATKTVSNAAQTCKTERAQDPAAFATKYGTNGKAGSKGQGKNAFGKCVSSAVEQATTAQAAAIKSAAASCKTERASDPAAFATKYGTNGKTGSKGAHKNAFGKCVATAAHTK
jgi:hypothetical protein